MTRQDEIGQSTQCLITAGVLTMLKQCPPLRLRILVDSGSTVTVIRDQSLFTKLMPTTINVADISGESHKAIGTGQVKVVINTTRGPQMITIQDCVCIPGFAADILSTQRMRRIDGYTFTLPAGHNGYMVSSEHTRTNFQSATDGLEYLEAVIPTPGVQYNHTYAASATKVTFTQWLSASNTQELQDRVLTPHDGDTAYHVSQIRQRLATAGIYMPKPDSRANDELMRLHLLAGHANVRVVASYAHRYLTRAEKNKLGKAAELFCKHCARTKSTRANTSRKAVITIAKPWSAMATDVIGPFAKPSIVGGFKYCILFVCRTTGSTRVIALSSLQQIPQRIDDQYTWIKTSHPSAFEAPELTREVVPFPHRLRSDHAQYFRTREALAIYAKYNIKHSMSAPHTQHANGACERAYRTLKESANAMRAHANLGPEFGFLALRHAAMIHNHLPTAKNKGLPPITAATGQNPNLGKFRIFGCDAYSVRPTAQVGEHRAILGLYVGHFEPSETHLVLLPRTKPGGHSRLEHCKSQQPGSLPETSRQRLVKTKHVTFDDKRLPQPVLDGTVPIEWPTYVPLDDDDANDVIDEIEIFGDGTTAAEVPAHDRTDQETIDVDYHRTHCVQGIEGCHCRAAPITASKTKHRLFHVKHVEAEPMYDTVSYLTATPRCMAANGIITSWKKAKKTPDVELYALARDAEVAQMIEKGIVEKRPITDVPPNTTIFNSLMNFTLKTTADHKVIKAKARWCFDGSRQIQGIHYDESTTYTVRHSTVRAHLAMAARKRVKVKCLDVQGAFLRGPKQPVAWMRSPHDQRTYTKGVEDVWAVTGNMYGRVDAAKIWFDFLSSFLTKLGYESSLTDPCLFVKNEGGGHWTQLVWHVDDACYWSTDPAKLKAFEEAITAEYGDCSIHEPALFLGINIRQGDGEIHISSRTLIERASKKFFATEDLDKINLTKAQTPFPSHNSAMGDVVSLDDCPDILNGEKPLDKPYRELVGTLLFITLTTRPDCAWHTSQLGRVQANPGERHWKLAVAVLKYLLATREYGISYKPVLTPMEYYTDASWGDVKPSTVKESNLYRLKAGVYTKIPDITLIDVKDPHARRSSFGFIGFLAGGPISWRSQIQQGRRALSTCEAELHAATEAAKDILHMKGIVATMHLVHTEPILLHEDNQSTIRVLTRMGITQRTKHYELRLYFLRDLGDVIHITYCPTQKMLADLLTKNLNVETLHGLRVHIVRPFGKRHALPTYGEDKG